MSSITGTVNGVTNPTFTYDANGNMTAGAGRTIAYTGFNMAASITEGSATTSLTYDSEHKRIVQSAPSATTTYLNDPMTGSMSEEVVSGATTTWHDYMAADGGIVAERFNTGGTVTVAYFNTDHLGSTAVLTDGSGTVAERDSFDAWGMRRNPNGTDAACGTITSATTRGYTGQEMMDALCAINMNARIYDPGMGRFMSADPTIPDPMNGQSFNRYSYVNNGPMSATDPSGLDGNTVEEEEKQKPIDTSLTDPFYAFNPPTGSRLYGGFTGDSSAAALLSAGEGGNFLADAVGGGNIQLYASAFGRSSTSGYWTPTVGGSYWGGIENSIETVVVWSTRSYWIPSSLTSIGGFQQTADTNGAGLSSINWGNAFSNFVPTNERFNSVVGCFGVCLGYAWTSKGQAYFLTGFGTPNISVSQEWTSNADNILLGASINVSYDVVSSSLSLSSPYSASGGVSVGPAPVGASLTVGIPLGTTQQVTNAALNGIATANTYPYGPAGRP